MSEPVGARPPAPTADAVAPPALPAPMEPAWFVMAAYGPDAVERRTPVRAEHLARLVVLMEDGTIAEAGSFTDRPTGSVLVVRAPDEAAVRAILEADVYWRCGVWVSLEIRPFARVAAGG